MIWRTREMTRPLLLGGLPLGGGNPVLVQSMTNTKTHDVEATLAQIERLAEAGCELARLAVPDGSALAALPQIQARSPMPLVADIHFDYRLALGALEAGLPALRINPGNIGQGEEGKRRIKLIVDSAKEKGAVIRIGVNSGSVERPLLDKYGGPTPQAMVDSALGQVRLFERLGFEKLKISIKSSNVAKTIQAYRLLAAEVDYPLHLGITEAGDLLSGTIKSAVGLGVLLFDGIGDTIRVSLTADPVEEVRVAWEILRAAGLRSRGPEIISCPTCGRTEIELIDLAGQIRAQVANLRREIKIAVMGCVVNGPGEAREADLGLAGGRDKGVIFRKGQVVRTVHGQANLLPAFIEELNRFLAEDGGEK